MIEPQPLISAHLHIPMSRLSCSKYYVAGDGDLDLTTMSVNVFTGSDPVKISFLFIKDLIAQEIDETFTLTLVDQGNFLAGYLTRLVLTGTILDEDSELTFLVMQPIHFHCALILLPYLHRKTIVSLGSMVQLINSFIVVVHVIYYSI